MKTIGFLFGNEKKFSQNIINKINQDNTGVVAEPIIIDIINNFTKITYTKYDVVFDRFSNAVPFYNSAMRFFTTNEIKVVSSAYSNKIEDELTVLSLLKLHKINVPKIAIIPSKNLPQGIHGDDMHNLKYPLNWEDMFDKIGFPANIKSNNSNDLFDTYRIYNSQDFFFIYDMSDTKTLLYQECIEATQNIRVYVIGDNKIYLNYELHKAPKDRYSIFEESVESKVEKSIDDIINTIKSLFNLDMFIIDVAINEKNKLYLLSISLFSMNLDTIHLPEEIYNWLVNSTAEMLVSIVGDTKTKLIKKSKK